LKFDAFHLLMNWPCISPHDAYTIRRALKPGFATIDGGGAGPRVCLAQVQRGVVRGPNSILPSCREAMLPRRIAVKFVSVSERLVTQGKKARGGTIGLTV
jgi:hypothetical protein